MTKRERQKGSTEDQWSRYAAHSAGRHKDDKGAGTSTTSTDGTLRIPMP